MPTVNVASPGIALALITWLRRNRPIAFAGQRLRRAPCAFLLRGKVIAQHGFVFREGLLVAALGARPFRTAVAVRIPTSAGGDSNAEMRMVLTVRSPEQVLDRLRHRVADARRIASGETIGFATCSGPIRLNLVIARLRGRSRLLGANDIRGLL
ncbi:MAG: hypothetical protein JO052_10025, partial [Bradyrhizobium sp.]|nr:hypothetical protein [Bradyrhizobium sp.]